MTRLNATKYGVNDARQRKEPADYIYEVIRRVKAAGFDRTEQQLTYAFQGLDPELKAMLEEPRADTTIESFLTAVEWKKQAWFEVYQQGTNRVFSNRPGTAPPEVYGRSNTPASYRRDFSPGYRSQTPFNAYSRPYYAPREVHYPPRSVDVPRQSIERQETPRYTPEPGLEQRMAPYNPTPWKRQQTPYKASQTPGPRYTPRPEIKRESPGPRQTPTPYRARAYHTENAELGPTNENEAAYQAYVSWAGGHWSG